MTETLYDRRRIRRLTVIDEGNREGLEIAMGVSFPSRRVTRVLSELVALHGCPSALRTDNGPEFTAQPLVDWCAEVPAGARAGAPKREGEMLTASRERGVIGCREIDAQHPEDRCQDALGLTQRSVEDETER